MKDTPLFLDPKNTRCSPVQNDCQDKRRYTDQSPHTGSGDYRPSLPIIV